MSRSAWMRTDDLFGAVTPCAVPFCMETLDRPDGEVVWICGRYWLHIPKELRRHWRKPQLGPFVLRRSVEAAIDGSHIDHRIRAGSAADVRRLQELCNG